MSSMKQETSLPPCDWRTPTSDNQYWYCRHASVQARTALVTSEVCGICSMRTKPSPIAKPQNFIEQPRMPGAAQRVWNLAKSLSSFVADGCTTVSKTVYQERLEICETCQERIGNRCRKCGCKLSLKARGRAFQCPLGRWDQQKHVHGS